MSQLQRSMMKAQSPRSPVMQPPPLMEESVELDRPLRPQASDQSPSVEGFDDSASLSSESSTGTIRPLPGRDLFARPQSGISRAASSSSSYDPLPWTSYFDQELYLESSSEEEDVIHHVYLTPPASSGPLFVMHHGAGSAALSFAPLAAEIRTRLPAAGVLAPDARGHGETVVKHGAENDSGMDWSLATLGNDLIRVVQSVQKRLDWPRLPNIILVGHSMGGPVVTEVAQSRALGDELLGYAILDVVEGSAMDALQSMQAYISTRPSSFPSVAKAIEWHIRSRTLRNVMSARVSVPALVEQRPTGSDSSEYVWRTDLSSTHSFWEGWFGGLSKRFLEARGGKLLILAGTDRLDKELMIGQMQGKYQLEVVPEAGHFVQEDVPEKTAAILLEFHKRNDRGAMVLPPKVADLLKMKQPV